MIPAAIALACIASATPIRLTVGVALEADDRARVALHADAVRASVRAVEVRRLPFALVLEVTDATHAKEILRARDDVAWVEEESYLWLHPRAVPDDPLYPEQWHLHDVGDPEIASDVHLDLEPAWEVTQGIKENGEPVRVAVLDDGFDLDHPDLVDRFAPWGCDLVGAGDARCDGDLEPGLEPGDWHGTQTAGVIAATGFNDLGVTGVCPACELLPIRLIHEAGPPELFTSGSQLAEAIVWAVDQGAEVINCSFGPGDGSPLDPGHSATLHPEASADRPAGQLPRVVDAAIHYAVTHGRGGLGTLVVWSAGNGNELVTYDRFASDPRVLAIGAVDVDGDRAYYSDYGPPLFAVAPSGGEREAPRIWSTDVTGAEGIDPSDYSSGYTGTSAATAMASGIAALVVAAYPELTAAQLREALADGAFEIDPRHGDYVSGRSPRYGFGRLDAANALQLAAGYTDGCTWSLELCGNEVDDNCDGRVDEASQCATCVPDQPREICDGHDNNCDGRNNEDFVCTDGGRPACAPCTLDLHCGADMRCLTGPGSTKQRCLPVCDDGQRCPDGFTCDGAVCRLLLDGETTDCDDYLICRLPESCDGLDNDCNGVVDDVDLDGEEAAVERARCRGEGLCLERGSACVSGRWRCDLLPDFEPVEQRCDGLDNDCDGEVDEGVLCGDDRDGGDDLLREIGCGCGASSLGGGGRTKDTAAVVLAAVGAWCALLLGLRRFAR